MYVKNNDISNDDSVFIKSLMIAIKYKIEVVKCKIMRYLETQSMSFNQLYNYDEALEDWKFYKLCSYLLQRRYIIKKPIYHNEYEYSINHDLLNKDLIIVDAMFLKKRMTMIIEAIQLK
jgi:hypothetical protein